MACVWTLEQMPGDTTAFLINEFNEYNELTKLTEFKLYDRHHQHWFEVKDGCMTVGYDLDDGSVIYLYRGKLDGSEGDITEEYLTIKQENYPNQDHHTVIGAAHGDMRRIVARLNFRAKDIWKETKDVIQPCDLEEVTVHLSDESRITKEFILNEVKEYTELTGLTEFVIDEGDGKHRIEVKDNSFSLTYNVSTLVYVDSPETSGIDQDYLLESRQKYRTDPYTAKLSLDKVDCRIHTSLRYLVVNIFNRSKEFWSERIILVCDHEEGATRRDGKLLTIGYKTNDCVLSAFGDYPLRCVIQVGNETYTLDTNWGESFVVYRHDEVKDTFIQYDPVDTLVLPRDHSVLRLLMEIEDD